MFNQLRYLLQYKTLTTKQRNWIENITTLDIEILHKMGKSNLIAIALSQKGEEMPSCANLVLG